MLLLNWYWYRQIPPEAESMAASYEPPAMESSPVSLLADATPIMAQPITEQVAEATSDVK